MGCMCGSGVKNCGFCLDQRVELEVAELRKVFRASRSGLAGDLVDSQTQIGMIKAVKARTPLNLMRAKRLVMQVISDVPVSRRLYDEMKEKVRNSHAKSEMDLLLEDLASLRTKLLIKNVDIAAMKKEIVVFKDNAMEAEARWRAALNLLEVATGFATNPRVRVLLEVIQDVIE